MPAFESKAPSFGVGIGMRMNSSVGNKWILSSLWSRSHRVVDFHICELNPLILIQIVELGLNQSKNPVLAILCLEFQIVCVSSVNLQLVGKVINEECVYSWGLRWRLMNLGQPCKPIWLFPLLPDGWMSGHWNWGAKRKQHTWMNHESGEGQWIEIVSMLKQLLPLEDDSVAEFSLKPEAYASNWRYKIPKPEALRE